MEQQACVLASSLQDTQIASAKSLPARSRLEVAGWAQGNKVGNCAPILGQHLFTGLEETQVSFLDTHPRGL